MENQSESLMESGTVKKARKVYVDNRMHGLDLLRVIFALLIVFGHYRVSATEYGVYEGDQGPRVYQFIRYAVEMFFVLSGLLIAKSLSGRSFVNYMIARLARIMPALVFCATITYMVALMFPHNEWYTPNWKNWLASVTTLPLLLNDDWGVDWAYWSLTYEFRFYFLAGLFLIFFRTERSLLIGTGVWVVLSLAALLSNNIPFEVATISRASGCFAMGIMLHFITTRPKYMVPALAIMALAMVATPISIVHEAILRDNGFVPTWPEAIATTFFMASCVGAFVYVRVPKSTEGIWQLGGMMTYPLYLLHQFVGWVIISKCADAGLPIDIAILIAFAVILPLAISISKWGEPMLSKIIKNTLKTSTAAIEPNVPKPIWKLLYTPQTKRPSSAVTTAPQTTADAQPALPT
jgi:peptidoglycan/LPS O-acetylase OafA/YrhL